MEIRSGKATKSQKILYSAMLLIHFGFLINAVFFLYFMIMIKGAIMALIEMNVAYSLNEK